MVTSEYMILQRQSVSEMEKAVDSYLLKGWQPQGGICIRETGLYQAMVRYAQPKSDDSIVQAVMDAHEKRT